MVIYQFITLLRFILIIIINSRSIDFARLINNKHIIKCLLVPYTNKLFDRLDFILVLNDLIE